MRIFPVDYSSVKVLRVLPPSEEHRNEIYVVALNETSWYAKKVSSPDVAVKNLLSAELYRLISDHPHPRTLVAKTEDNEWYSLSQDLNETHEAVAVEDLSGNPGFADVLVVSVWLHEIDLRFPNLLVSRETGAIAKIDGECSFFSLVYPEHEHEISGITLKMLPFPHRYPTYNWLGHIKDNRLFALRDFHYPNELPEAFEKEKNRALLRICLLPNIFIMSLCKTILFNKDEASFNDFLMERREQIRSAALVSDSFRTYLSSSEAQSELRSFLKELKIFTTHGLRIIPDSKIENLGMEYMAACRQLGLVSSPSSDKENYLSSHSMFASHVSRELGATESLPRGAPLSIRNERQCPSINL